MLSLRNRFNWINNFLVFLSIFYFTAGCGDNKSLNGIYNIRDFGAIGDGKQLETKAIQAAIDAATQNGGRVLLPAGKYLSGTLFMKSNVTLQIGEGATLLGSTNLSDYPEVKYKLPTYNNFFLRHSLIYAEDLENIAIIGPGTIDGQGSAFKVVAKKKPDKYKKRPYIFRIVNCKNVHVENLRLQNSASWMQHYFACQDVFIRGLYVYNHCNKNNDMIDIDGCKNVVVSDCISDTDDDAITIKSTSGLVAENISITNCVVSSHCNAIKFGTESHGGFKNITISNIVVKPSQKKTCIAGTEQGLAGIVLAIVDGGELDGVSISNVRINGPQVPIFLRLGNRGRIYKEDQQKPPIGNFRNVNISNIVAIGADTIGCSITGLAGHMIENVSLSNIRIHFNGGVAQQDTVIDIPEKPEHYPESDMYGELPAYGFFIRHVNGISLNQIDLKFDASDYRPALICDDVQNLDVSGFRAQTMNDTKSLMKLTNTQDVLINGCRPLSNVNTLISIYGEHSKRIRINKNSSALVKNVIEFGKHVNKKEIKVIK